MTLYQYTIIMQGYQKNVTARLLFRFTGNKYDIGILLTISQITNTYIHTLVCVFSVQRKILRVNFKKEFGNIFPFQADIKSISLDLLQIGISNNF